MLAVKLGVTVLEVSLVVGRGAVAAAVAKAPAEESAAVKASVQMVQPEPGHLEALASVMGPYFAAPPPGYCFQSQRHPETLQWNR